MSFGYASVRQNNSKILPTFSGWVRPSEWISVPSVGATEQKFVGLLAIMPENGSNYVAVLCQGNYTVDWGDGSAPENVNSNTSVTHNYDYASVGNLTSYGYKQVLVTITPQAGQNLTVVNIRQKPAGVGTVVQYIARWLDIEVGSPNLTSLVIGGNNTLVNLTMLERVRWVSKSTSYTSTIDFFYYCTGLQEIIIDADMSNVTGLPAFFYFCTKLKYAPKMNTSSVTDISNMFGNCYNLIYIPAYDFSKVTNYAIAFANCYKLQKIPLFNTSNVTNFASAYLNCYELQNVPNIDGTKVNSFTSMFGNCRSLTSVTINNAGNANNFSNTFSNCTELETVYINGTYAAGTTNVNFTQTFLNCNALVEVSVFDTSRANNMTSMFQGCSSLEAIPSIDTSNNINFSSMFSGCGSISNIANLNTSKGNNFTQMFLNCYELTSAPPFNLSNANNVSSMYQGCTNISTLPNYNLANVIGGGGTIISNGIGLGTGTPLINSNITNIRFTITYLNCGIQKANLETIMNNLGSVGGASQSFTITSNPGADTALSKTATWTNTSNVMTMANTVGVTVGAQVTGANIGNAVAITINANNKISTTNLIDNNTMVAFANVQTSNLLANTLYWVSNQANSAGTYYFDVAASNGGTPLTFTAGTGNLNINRLVTAVNTNANITLSAFPSGNGTAATATTRILNTNIAAFKGWTVTG